MSIMQAGCSSAHGLLVADFDVAPSEEVEKLAIAPQLAEVDAEPRVPRLDDDEGLLGQIG